MEKGKCCEYCTKHEKPECPVKNAEPWSRWRNFCSEFEGNEKVAMCDSEHIAPVVRSNATTGWIKVSERLPKYKQKVLLYNKNLRYPHVGEMVFSDERGSHFKCETIVFGCFEGKKDCCKGFTHWMPLPDAPEV